MSISQAVRNRAKDVVLGTWAESWIRALRDLKRPARKHPDARWWNGALKSRKEWQDALVQVHALKLPPHNDSPKNWDGLAALDCILRNTNRRATILDAGAESYSVILSWLQSYGYKNLTGINLTFNKAWQRGWIRYEHGDITRTRFSDATFDVVVCLSVIEHGVSIPAYFAEMARIVKPGGLLITSCDYWDEGVDAKGQVAFGVPIHVYSRHEIEGILDTAKSSGFKLLGKLSLDCREKAVSWRDYGLEYTFAMLSMRKAGGKGAGLQWAKSGISSRVRPLCGGRYKA